MTIEELDKDFDELVDYLNKFEKSMNNDEESLSFFDYSYSEIMYNRFTHSLAIPEKELLQDAINHLVNRNNCTFKIQCDVFSFLLNHYYPGGMDELINQNIEVENYENCARLVNLKSINTLPYFER